MSDARRRQVPVFGGPRAALGANSVDRAARVRAAPFGTSSGATDVIADVVGGGSTAAEHDGLAGLLAAVGIDPAGVVVEFFPRSAVSPGDVARD